MEWERVDSVPPRGGSGSRRRRERIELAPGEVRRRKVENRSVKTLYRDMFLNSGRNYHTAVRRIDGQLWLYIWRDPADA